MKRFSQRRREPARPAHCYFCMERVEPSYRDVTVLERYTTDRGKIIARARTGTCRRHQRRLMLAVKHARHLALLPFIPGALS